MKRTLSLVLALVMVLGTFSATFAAEATVEEKAGEILKALEVMTGDSAGLRLEDGLKREEAVVMIARLKGQLEEAQKFPTKPTYKDITNKAYESLLAWAQEDGTFVGHNEAKFGFGDNITAQEYASVLLRILGYEVGVEKEITWNDVMAKAEKLGLLKNIDADADFLRGNMAVMTLNALRTEMKDSKETLAEKLELDVPAEEVELSTDIEIKSAAAIANNKVEVKVEKEVAASKADFTIVKKGSTTELEIKDVVKESAKVFVLETEALTAGTSYTVKSNGKAINFAGIAVDKTAPTVKSAKGVDTNTFEVEFSDRMDFASATNVENYTFDKDLKVVSAELSSSRKVITLTVDAAKKNTTYKLTIENLLNSDGVVAKKTSHNVRAIEYTTAPTIKGTPKVISSTLVELTFNAGTFGMNKESLETVENYTIEGLEVTEAKAYDLDEDYLYETVLLTTGEQDVNKSYKLTIAGVTDDSVLKNVLKTKTLSFRGMRADKTAPAVLSAMGANGNEVKVMFSDASAMSIGSMTDVSNYKITYKDGSQTLELGVLEAEALASEYPDLYDNAYKGVVLQTEEQIEKKPYVIEISNVEDEYGNAMKSTRKLTFTGTTEDLTPPTVKSVKHTDKGVVIVFSESLNKAIAQDPTNYTINGDIGSAIKATASKTAVTNDTVTLTTGNLTANKEYTVTIEDIEDKYGNEMPSRGVKFVAIASSLDITAPSFSYAYAENSSEVHINFDEAIASYPNNMTVGVLALEQTGKINDGTTVVYKVNGTMASQTYTFPTAIFADAAGNQVNIKDNTFAGIANVANENPTVEYVEQTNAKTIVISFNEPVKLAPENGVTATKVDTSSVNTHEIEWKVVFPNKLTYGSDYTVTLNAEDLGGNKLVSHKFTADYYDDVAPSIVGVTAADNQTVVVEYDEDLEHPGTYEIYYLDRNNNKVKSTVQGKVMTARNKVSVPYSTKGTEIYYLTAKVGSVDYAANREKADGTEWDFSGSDVLKTKSYITGVSIINAKKVNVKANFNIVTAIVYEIDGDVRTVVGHVYDKDDTTVTVDTVLPLLDGVEYEVIAKNSENNEYTFQFNGVTPDLGLKLEKVDGAYKVTSYGTVIDPEVYTETVKAVDGTPVALGSVASGTTYYVELVKGGTVVYAMKVIAE